MRSFPVIEPLSGRKIGEAATKQEATAIILAEIGERRRYFDGVDLYFSKEPAPYRVFWSALGSAQLYGLEA